MPTPACTITVDFFEDPEPSFTYFCVNQPPPWQVFPNGNICPPTRSRLIQLKLNSAPAGAEFLGLRVSTDPGELKNTNEPYLNDPGRTHVTIVPASASDPSILLDDDARAPSPRLWWSVGILLDGVAHWDDPKIYNPPGD